jgi:glucosamine--fructose-6-phosphate aminotransferase (isomerizing)
MVTSSHLYREIHQQPVVIELFLKTESDAVRQLAKVIQGRKITHVVIAARGTSDNAGRYAKYVLGAMNGLTVALATPSLFSIYKQPPNFRDSLVLGISQSGESPDIVAVLAEAQQQGALTAVITNNPSSDLAQHGDMVINLNVGKEKSIAATKTYTTELVAIACLSANLTGDKQMASALSDIPVAIESTLCISESIAKIAPRYRYMERSVVIGRGYNYATAFELALKMKELTYSIVEPYSSADFLHGPLAMIEHGFPVIVIAPTGMMHDEMRYFMLELKDRQAEIICISDDPGLLSLARIPLTLPHTVPEWLSPMTAIVPGQLFALHLAHARDYDVDNPRSLRKVTKTR